VAFGTVFFVSMRRNLPVGGIMAYALIEGVAIGAISKLFEFLYPGIVFQAVLGTLMAAAATFAVYRFGGVRIRGKAARAVMIGTAAFAGVMLVNLLLSLFGAGLGLAAIGATAGPLSYLSAAVGVVLAVFNLMMDFDAIEEGIRRGAPAEQAWVGVFGLLVTLVWLYTTILRILSYFRN